MIHRYVWVCTLLSISLCTHAKACLYVTNALEDQDIHVYYTCGETRYDTFIPSSGQLQERVYLGERPHIGNITYVTQEGGRGRCVDMPTGSMPGSLVLRILGKYKYEWFPVNYGRH